jgi:hypothetical protein
MDDRQHLYVYSADIPAAFLDKLNYPAVPPEEPTRVSIQITSIPYKPYGSLRDRIFALLIPTERNGTSGERIATDQVAKRQAKENWQQAATLESEIEVL